MLKDKAGNQLFRKMTVKVIFPNAIFPDKTFVQHAGPKQGFGPEGIDAMLENIADQLDTLYPWWDFTYVQLTPVGRTARFVFTFAGNRATAPASPVFPTADSTTPEPETADGNIAAHVAEPTPQAPPSQELVQS